METGKACREKADALNGKVFETWITGATGTTNNGQADADRKIPAEDAIRTALIHVVQAGVHDIQNMVETLATSLQDELVKSANDLAITDVPGDNEFLSLVRDMPAFDPGTIQVTAHPSLFTALRGNRWGKKPVEQKIRRQFDQSLGMAFSGYFRVLKEWASQVTSRMGQKFETYAERYRAQAELSPPGQELTAVEVSAIEKDLNMLGDNSNDEKK